MLRFASCDYRSGTRCLLVFFCSFCPRAIICTTPLTCLYGLCVCTCVYLGRSMQSMINYLLVFPVVAAIVMGYVQVTYKHTPHASFHFFTQTHTHKRPAPTDFLEFCFQSFTSQCLDTTIDFDFDDACCRCGRSEIRSWNVLRHL